MKKVILFLSILIISYGCITTKKGSGYQRVAGAEGAIGHAMLFFQGAGDCKVEVRHRGNRVDNFEMLNNTYTIIPLRDVGAEYSIRLIYEFRGFSTTYKGRRDVKVTSQTGSVHGIKLEIKPAGIISRASYSLNEELFTGEIAKELLNPRYEVFLWNDLVSRNRIPDNIQPDLKSEPAITNQGEIEIELERLKNMLDNGLISEEEYLIMRKRVIERL